MRRSVAGSRRRRDECGTMRDAWQACHAGRVVQDQERDELWEQKCF